ncbi:MAG TPA: BatD family protein [Pseudobdellovibrionaceae bacterium]|nr:BatD family protein [Pseudobdellovibrionaceae bacterium]
MKRIGEILWLGRALRASGWNWRGGLTGGLKRSLMSGGLCAFGMIALSLLGTPLTWASDAKVQVTAEAEPQAIEPSGTVVLNVIVTSDRSVAIEPPTLPPMSDFEVIGNFQSSETRATLVQTPTGPQFQSVQRSVFSFQLSPKRIGALSIFPVEVVVDGKAYRTKALTVRVAQGAGQAARPRPQPNLGMDEEGEDLFDQLLKRGLRQLPQGGTRTLPTNPNEAFFIQVETDKTEAYVGEQITVSFYLYTTGIIRELDTLRYPSLKGFWKEDIEIATQLNFQQEVIDGVAYKKALLASYALFPIKEGTSTIDSYQVRCSVIPGADPFGGLGMGRQLQLTKSSLPVKVQVKALPTEGRPADFTGAVGEFQVTARMDEKNPIAHQPFPVKIRFEGRGNAKMIELPALQLPEGLELYDTRNEAKFFNWGTSFKEFTLFIIPRRDGDFELPPFAASIFDPKTKSFVRRSTEAMRFRVQASQGAQSQRESFQKNASAAPSAPRGPRLPEPVLVYEAWAPSAVPMGALGLSGFALLCLAGLGLHGVRLFGKWGRPTLQARLKQRLKALDKVSAQGEAAVVGVQAVNAMAFTLGEIVGDYSETREVARLIQSLPPSLKQSHGEELHRLLTEFEAMAFAPSEALGELARAEARRERVVALKKALQRVVELSGSGERSI